MSPVYSIWIVTDARNDLKNTVICSEMTSRLLQNESDLDPKDIEELSYKDSKIITIHAGNFGEAKKGILRLVSILLAPYYKCSTNEKIKLLKDEFGILATKTDQQVKLEEDLNSMCNISDYIEARGIAIGKTEGIAIGEAKTAIKLHELGIPPENIKAGTGFTYEEAVLYLKKLEKESKSENK